MEAYLRYMFSDSVSEQYSAFSSGFLKVCGGEILLLFQPCELMAMVVGNNNYNWEVMEKVGIKMNTLDAHVFITVPKWKFANFVFPVHVSANKCNLIIGLEWL